MRGVARGGGKSGRGLARGEEAGGSLTLFLILDTQD